MNTLLDQIEASLDSGHYFLSLYTALTIPDIAGALESENGQASGNKYIAWYEEWGRPRFAEEVLKMVPASARECMDQMENPLTGDACYRFRCSLLHQGSSQHPKSPFDRIIFIEPGATTNTVHYGTLNNALCIDLVLFCKEMISGGRMWLAHVEEHPTFQKNYEQFARRHANGLAPYIGGVPVVG